MTNTIIEDSSNIIGKSEKVNIRVLIDNHQFYYSIWFWFAFIELIIVFFLINKLIKINKINKTDIIKGGGNLSSSDMDNLINSIHNSKSLYKELNRVCHPDRFINDEKILIAESIFQEITENEKNYSKLLKLKSRAEKELSIKFL